MMKSIIKDALILFVITAVAGLLLAIVNEVTKSPILQRQQETKDEACHEVFQDAFSFEACTEEVMENPKIVLWNDNNPKVSVDEIYYAKTADGSVLGYVFTLTTKEGYGGDITFSMGISSDRTLNGISILASSETVGLGLEAEDVLVPQFAGKNVDVFSYTKTGSTGPEEIDAISSATITTNAFVNAVNSGLELFDALSGEEVTVNE